MSKLKAEARRSGRSFKELVNSLLRLALNAKRVPRPAEPFVVRDRPMGVHPGVDYDNVGDLLEDTEGPLHP